MSPNDTRLSQAAECLVSAQQLILLGDFKASANRSYYSIFHAIGAGEFIWAIDVYGEKDEVVIIMYDDMIFNCNRVLARDPLTISDTLVHEEGMGGETDWVDAYERSIFGEPWFKVVRSGRDEV
jgi:hypothetical protein